MNRESTEVRKQQIIEASLKIISEKGLGSLTTAEIAKEIGISEATIFRHFNSKKEIMEETSKFIQRTLLDGAGRIQNKPLHPLEKLKEMTKFHLNLIKTNQGFPQIVFWEHVHQADNTFKDLTLQTIEGYLAVIKQIIAEGIERGHFKEELDLEIAAQAYLGLIQVNIMKSLLGAGNGSLEEQGQAIFNFLASIIKK
jgi:AcrR family transcriptional regulator